MSNLRKVTHRPGFFALIFVVIIVSLDILYSATAKLTVTSTPSAAKIYLDGADTGQVTPYTLTDIGVGGYGIEFL